MGAIISYLYENDDTRPETSEKEEIHVQGTRVSHKTKNNEEKASSHQKKEKTS